MFNDFVNDREPDVTLAPREILFTENDEASKAYIITSGAIDLSIRGHELTTLGVGELVGEMALVDEKLRFATAAAGGQGAKLCSLDRNSFIELIKKDPHFALDVMKLMAQRLRMWGDQFD